MSRLNDLTGQIFFLDSAAVKTKTCLAHMGTANVCNASPQGNNRFNLTYCDRTKKMALNLQRKSLVEPRWAQL